MPKKKPKKSPVEGSGWNEAAYIQRIKSLEQQLKDKKVAGQNLENETRRANALEKTVQEQKELLDQARPLLQENQRLRRKLRAGEGAAEVIAEILSGLMQNRPTKIVVPQPQVLRARSKPEEECVGVAHLADIHMGKITPSYDSKIAADRIREYGRKVTKCLKVHHASADIQDLRVYITGDVIEGEQIFAHQAHLIDSSVFQQACFDAPEVLAEVIAGWASVFKTVKVCCVPGNHGRVGPKGTNSNPQSNWDRVCYRAMEMLLKPVTNVTLKVAKTFYIVDDVLGTGNLLVHGHEVRGGFAGIPFYGISRKASGWIDAIPETWQNLFLSHFHTPISGRFNGRWWFVNGSMESDNEYSQSELASAGKPCQRLLIFNKRHGPVVDLLVNLTEGLDS